MSINLTFNDVCTTIKKQGEDDPTLIEAVDNLLGLALICSPVALGPTAIAALPTLAVKNELVKIGKSVFEKFTKKKARDYISRYESMRTAYGLLTFTSFLDALDACLSQVLRDALARSELSLATAANAESLAIKSENATKDTYTFSFPHPTETLADQCQQRTTLWKRMAQSFVEFVQKQPFYDEADEETRQALLSGLENVEEEAVKRFQAQFFELARRFEDFAVWAQLYAHPGAERLIRDLSQYVKQHAELSAVSEARIDVGFADLREAVLNIPETLRIHRAVEITASLKRHYEARIDDPIIEEKEMGNDEPQLVFPKVRDAFIPQAFHVIQRARDSRSLEDESTWTGLPRRNDLGAFLLSYLSSPYSTDTPLLILGHPGSGKSLLTTVLSARLMSKHFTAIRVPLREVNADADIATQIEEFVRRISGDSDSWIKLRSRFKNCPPLVILDGYDELLQASGQVFASYIMDAQRFQQHQSEQKWPVRIIITSRVTLIDKAAVPVGSTIIRLLEFDQQQRERWSDIWNSANAAYFKDVGIEEFTLPRPGETGADKILNLAEQPLLLLMLALYDSQGNQLRGSAGLDRTKLYDSLLRRFVIRERSKEKEFGDAKAQEQERVVSLEMQRLGVAALGMYNRRQVHILSRELDDDLAFFDLERDVTANAGKPLSQADLLLGSFFFVHKSKAEHRSGAEDTHEEASAFEFLHSTFGEFLMADFALRRTVSQVKTLRTAEADESLKSLMETMLGKADGFGRDWFASLVYTPLFTRPVIMEMIREWTPHVLQGNELTEGDFNETLERIVLNQIKRLLNKREMPPIMRKETVQEGYRVPFEDHPLLGHMAIYSINLVLLRLIAGRAPFVFEECAIARHEDGTRPWDRLIHMWRSWFSLGNLNGMAAVMLAERSGESIKVGLKDKFQVEEGKSRLRELHNVALSLGDDVTAGLAGLWLIDPSSDSTEKLRRLEEKLSSEDDAEVGLAISIAELRVLAAHSRAFRGEFAEHGRRTLEQAIRRGRIDQLEIVSDIIARALEKHLRVRGPIGNADRVLRQMLPPHFVVELAMRDPRSARVLYELGRQSWDSEWILEVSMQIVEYLSGRLRMEIDERGSAEWVQLLGFVREFAGGSRLGRYRGRRRARGRYLERALHPQHFVKLLERNPEGAVAYLQILRELGGARYFSEFVVRRIGPAVFGRMRRFAQGRLGGLMEENPEGALAYLQVAREVGSERDVERLVKQEIGPRLLRRGFRLRYFLRLFERSPRAAVEYVQVLREMGGTRYFEGLLQGESGAGMLKRIFHQRDLLEGGPYGMSWLSVWLACARLVESQYLNRVLVEALREESEQVGDLKGRLALLPISSLGDLRWLAAQAGELELKSLVEELSS